MNIRFCGYCARETLGEFLVLAIGLTAMSFLLWSVLELVEAFL